MQYFVEQAETLMDAERKVREKYGDRATITLKRTVMLRGGFLGLFHREGVEVLGHISSGAPKSQGNPPVDFEEARQRVLAAAGRAPGVAAPAPDTGLMQEVLKEVRDLKEKVKAPPAAPEEHPTLKKLEDVLAYNDFPPAYIRETLARAKRELSLEELGDYDLVQERTLEWIGESVQVYRDGDGAGKEPSRERSRPRRPRIIALVGPTGVGKTTTIAKLAANFGIDAAGEHTRQIALVTTDTYKIGAKEQIKSLTDIMHFPCFVVDDYDELKKTIALNAEGTDIILIDTIGRSHRNRVELGQMNELLEACGPGAEVYLALAATTKSSDALEILQQFEPFNYRSVIVTKLDETIRTGNIIGALAEKRKPVSYITNGQKVPTDIRRATVMQFLINLEGFDVDRNKLEKLFPEN